MSGSHGFAGEIGHVSVSLDGPPRRMRTTRMFGNVCWPSRALVEASRSGRKECGFER
ncbi:MAG: hypothetical protein V9G11_09280 [Bifidobacterium adolescentis]